MTRTKERPPGVGTVAAAHAERAKSLDAKMARVAVKDVGKVDNSSTSRTNTKLLPQRAAMLAASGVLPEPIDSVRPRRDVTVRSVGRESIEFDGPGVIDAIKTVGCGSMRARFGGGWLVPAAAGEDVLALLEYRGFPVDVTL